MRKVINDTRERRLELDLEENISRLIEGALKGDGKKTLRVNRIYLSRRKNGART